MKEIQENKSIQWEYPYMVFTFLLEKKGNVPCADEGHVILTEICRRQSEAMEGEKKKTNTFI